MYDQISPRRKRYSMESEPMTRADHESLSKLFAEIQTDVITVGHIINGRVPVASIDYLIIIGNTVNHMLQDLRYESDDELLYLAVDAKTLNLPEPATVKMNLADHHEAGRILKHLRKRIPDISQPIWDHFLKASSLYKNVFKLGKKIDLLRSELDDQLAKKFPKEFSIRVYYGT